MRWQAWRPDRDLVIETAHYALVPLTFTILAVLSIGPILRRASDWGVQGLGPSLAFLVVSLSPLLVAAVVARVLSPASGVSDRRLVVMAIGLWTAVGVVRLLLESWAGHALGNAEPALAIAHIVSSVVANLAWPAFFAIVQATTALRLEEGAELDADVERLRERSLARWKLLDVERTSLARSIKRTIAPTIDELSALIEDRGTPWQDPTFAELVRSVADRSRELVREASHEMQVLAKRSDQLGSPVIGPRPAVEQRRRYRSRALPNLTSQDVRLEPIAGSLVLLAVFGSVILGRADLTAVVLLLVSVLAIALVLWAVSALLRPRGAVAVALVYAMCSGIAVACAGLLARRFLGGNAPMSFMQSEFPVWGALLVWATGFATYTIVSLWTAEQRALVARAAARAKTRDALDELERDMARQYDRMCAQTATMLHGPVQGRLATIAMTLRFQGASISAESLEICRELLHSCIRDLDHIADEPIDRPTSLVEILLDLRAQWTGMLDISWQIDSLTARFAAEDPDRLLDVESMLADLASNASRHGQARRMRIEIHEDDGGIDVIARDDGRGPVEPIDTGSGLGALGVRGTDWDIWSEPDGWCRVEVRMRSRAEQVVPPLAPR